MYMQTYIYTYTHIYVYLNINTMYIPILWQYLQAMAGQVTKKAVTAMKAAPVVKAMKGVKSPIFAMKM